MVKNGIEVLTAAFFSFIISIVSRAAPRYFEMRMKNIFNFFLSVRRIRKKLFLSVSGPHGTEYPFMEDFRIVSLLFDRDESAFADTSSTREMKITEANFSSRLRMTVKRMIGRLP